MSIESTYPVNQFVGKLIHSAYVRNGYTSVSNLGSGYYNLQQAGGANLTAVATFNPGIKTNRFIFTAVPLNIFNVVNTSDITLQTAPSLGQQFPNPVGQPVTYDGTYFYLNLNRTDGQAQNGSILYSTNFITWSFRNISGTTPASINRGFGYNSNTTEKYVYLASTTGTSAIYTSTDAITWTTRNSGSTTTTKTGLIINANATNKFVMSTGATTANKQFLYSTDAITWVEAGTTNSPSSYDVRPFGATNNTASTNEIYVYPISTSGRVATSTDGITWTTRSVSAGAVSGIVWFNNYYLAFFANSTTYNYSTDGITWSVGTLVEKYRQTINAIMSHIINNKLYAPVESAFPFSPGCYNVTTNGTTWTLERLFQNDLNMIEHNNTVYVYSTPDTNLLIGIQPPLYCKIYKTEQ